jgi:hypothetical protein
MGLKASGQVRFLTSLPSNFNLKNRGQQLKRMYSAMPDAVRAPSVSSSSPSATSMLKSSSTVPAPHKRCLFSIRVRKLLYLPLSTR